MSEGSYANYLAQTGMSKPAELGEVGLKSIGDFGKFLTQQNDEKINLGKQLQQKDFQFEQQQALEQQKMAQQEGQFQQELALKQAQAARDEQRALRQDEIAKTQLDMSLVKAEREKLDYSKEENINKTLSDPILGKKFMDAAAAGNLDEIYNDPKLNAVYVSMLTSKQDNTRAIANQLLTKAQENKQGSIYSKIDPEMNKIMSEFNAENASQKYTDYITRVGQKVSNGEMTKKQADEAIKLFEPLYNNIKIQNQQERLELQQRRTTAYENNLANSGANSKQYEFYRQGEETPLSQDEIIRAQANGESLRKVEKRAGQITNIADVGRAPKKKSAFELLAEERLARKKQAGDKK